MMSKGYILITGGTEGIGLELSKLYSIDKNNLILVAKNGQRLMAVKKQLEKKYNNSIEIIPLDLSIHNEREKLIKIVEEKNLVVDKLINNAGIGSFGEFSNNDLEKELTMNHLNMDAVAHLTHYFLNNMKRNGKGGIMNIASTAGFSVGPKMANYYATKAYVIALTEAIHEEVKGSNIKISCLCPGAVKTEFQSKAGIKKSEKVKGYMMSAEQVAREGYNGFKKGKVIIIPGFKNRIIILASRILPRVVNRRIILKMNS